MNSKCIYLANLWDGLLPISGLNILEARGWTVRGNWLSGEREAAVPPKGATIIWAPSLVPRAINNAVFDASMRVVPWILFPDQVLYWDPGLRDYTSSWRFSLDLLSSFGVCYVNSE